MGAAFQNTAEGCDIPYWACVAFVARCAERVLPVFDAAWPDAPKAKRDLLVASIDAGWESARRGKCPDEVGALFTDATSFVGSLVLTYHPEASGMHRERGAPEDPEKCYLATHSASVAARVTQTAWQGAEMAHANAMDAWSWAVEVAQDDRKLIAAMHDDYDALMVAASRGCWTDETPVVWDDEHGWRTAQSTERAQRSSNNVKLEEFLEKEARADDPKNVGRLEKQPPSVMDDMRRRRRRYSWAVTAPLFLIAGLLSLRFLVIFLTSVEPGRHLGFLDLGITLISVVIAGLVYVKFQQDRADR